MTWWMFAFVSALAASATAILAKIGIKGVPSNLATAVRTGVVLVFAWGIVFATGDHRGLRDLRARSLLFLVLSGVGTGLSWLAYFKALQMAPASRVAPIDKLSLAFTIVLAALPAFAMIRIGAGTIGLLSAAEARKEGVEEASAAQKRAIHVEFSSDDLDDLYEELEGRGVEFHQPPHDEPWERSMTAFDPDGYAIEFAQGKRGHHQTKA